jgi:hypothetical protein
MRCYTPDVARSLSCLRRALPAVSLSVLSEVEGSNGRRTLLREERREFDTSPFIIAQRGALVNPKRVLSFYALNPIYHCHCPTPLLSLPDSPVVIARLVRAIQ